MEVFRVQLNPVQHEFDRAQARLQAELTRLRRARDVKAGIACLGYALFTFILTFLIFNFFRRSSYLGRYAAIGTSSLGFGVVRALLVSLKIA